MPSDEEKKAIEEKEAAQAKETQVADLMAQVKSQGDMLGESKKAIDQLTEKLQDSTKFLTDPEYQEYLDEKESGKSSSIKGDETDLNAMSRAEFAASITKGITDILTDAAKNMDKQIAEVRGDVGNIYKMSDIRFAKNENPEFAKLLATDEGKKRYVEIQEKNPKFSSKEIWEDIKKDNIVKEKEETDLKEAQALKEKEVWSEKPAAAANIAEDKNMTEDDVIGKIFDAEIGTLEQPLEEKSGVIEPMDD